MKKYGIGVLLGCVTVILVLSLLGCPMEPKLYMVTFDTDGGSAVNAQSVQENGKATRPADPTKSGYTFGGWYAENTFDIVWNFDTTITEDTTLYAKWKGPEVGDLGPSGGYVFYDDEIGYDLSGNGTIEESEKNLLGDGWRYLEAAPADVILGGLDYSHIFGYYRTASNEASTLVGGTATDVGTGKTNTDALVAAMGDAAYTSYIPSTTTTTGKYAARLCDIHEAGGFSDWFLPSKDELDCMYDNLKSHTPSLGGFFRAYYWSSSEDNAYLAWYQFFGDGDQDYSYRHYPTRVRPVRAF